MSPQIESVLGICARPGKRRPVAVHSSVAKRLAVGYSVPASTSSCRQALELSGARIFYAWPRISIRPQGNPPMLTRTSIDAPWRCDAPPGTTTKILSVQGQEVPGVRFAGPGRLKKKHRAKSPALPKGRRYAAALFGIGNLIRRLLVQEPLNVGPALRVAVNAGERL